MAQKYQEIATKQAAQYHELLKCQDELEKKVALLESQIAQAEKMIEELEHGVERLIGQLKSHDVTPVWQPKKRERKAA